MSSQAVGFQFQGDVIGGSSLLYTATGRLLKALNHGGVDFYAVAASVQLGKLTPLTQERESAICKLLEQRRASRESYLSKALRIGWGHSDIPHELARTKAGVSALNVIGVLATGCKPFEAAKALSTLMEMNGCEADALPSLDSLSNMIDFLSPFITNSTFDSVIANVRLGDISVLAKNGLVVPKALETKGDSTQWARTVKHLVATTQAVENAHIAVGQRGAWLAAYAAHILGLSVTIYSRDIILWEAAGTNGSVTMYLYDDRNAVPVALAKPLSVGIQLERLEPAQSSDRAPYMLPLSQLVESGMAWVTTAQMTDQAYSFTFDKIIADDILETIFHFSEQVFDNVPMHLQSGGMPRWPINGHFPQRKQALLTTLQHLGITSLSQDHSTIPRRKWNQDLLYATSSVVFEHFEGPLFHRVFSVLPYLHYDTAIRISRLCNGPNVPESPRGKCLCCRTALFIFEMSVLAVALAQCSYDEKIVRINENVLRTWKRSDPDGMTNDWLDFNSSISTIAYQNAPLAYYDSLFLYLTRVLHRDEAHISAMSSKPLAWSEGGVAIYIRALFNSDYVDDFGRALVITSGQISCNGLRRHSIGDEGHLSYSRLGSNRLEGTFNTFDVNTEIAPLSATGPIAHRTIVNVQSHTVGVEFRLFDVEQSGDRSVELSMGLLDILEHLLASCKVIGKTCRHDPRQTYVVKQAHSPLTLHTFGDLATSLHSEAATTLIFAVAGSSLSQLMQIVLLGKRAYCVALQRNSCLDCIIAAARNHEKETASKTVMKTAVIMA